MSGSSGMEREPRTEDIIPWLCNMYDVAFSWPFHPIANTRYPMTTRSLPVCVLTACLLTVCARADDWPQWRGPERTGISKETGLLREWPKDGPTLLWEKKEIGGGDSTPAGGGDRLYLMADRKGWGVVIARAVKDRARIRAT